MSERLPVIIDRAKIIGDVRAHVMPTVIAASGVRASLRFLEFLAANIRNPAPRVRPRRRGIYDLVRRQQGDIDHGRAAASRLGLDRATDLRACGTDRQAAPGGHSTKCC
jgi:hypothetical protein